MWESIDKPNHKGYFFTFLISLILSISIFFGVSINITATLERGPKFLFFCYFLSIIFFIISIIFLIIWVQLKFGSKSRNYLLISLVLIIILTILIFKFNLKLKDKEYKKIFINGIERQYRIYIPNSFNISNENNSLLLGLHGGMGNAADYQSSSKFDIVSEKYNFLMVYPDGLGDFKYIAHVWNSGTIEAGLEKGVDDVLFLSKLIEKLIIDYNINSKLVYMTGHSNGAMMTYRMAGEKSELFKGVAPTSGSIGGSPKLNSPIYIIPKPNYSLNIVHIHGFKDINVPYNGGYPSSGFYVDNRFDLSVNESINFWIQSNHCSNISIDEYSLNNKIKLNSYYNGINSTFVKLITFIEQNHFWKNLDQEQMKEKFKNGESLAELIWILLTK